MVVDTGMPYVSRGGFKLAGALVEFGVDVNGAAALEGAVLLSEADAG